MPERGAGGGQNSPAKIRMTERQLEALRLRRARQTFEQVGAALGISRQAAKQLVHRAYDKLETERDEMARYALLEELETLDALQRTAYTLATTGGLQQSEYDALPLSRKVRINELRLNAMERVLHIGDQRNKMLGLYKPDRMLLFGASQFNVTVNQAADNAESHAGFLESGDIVEGDWSDIAPPKLNGSNGDSGR